MISVSRRSSGASCDGLGEQLRGVAHRADRVSDLVGDARRQPAERRELGLLDALGDRAGVGEEGDHGTGAVAAERGEMRLELAAAVGGDQRGIGQRHTARAPPALDVVEQPRRDLAEQRPRPRLGAEQLAGRLVDQPHAVGGVDHDDALAQVLHDVLGQFREVGDVDVALADHRLGVAQAAGHRGAGTGGEEQHRAVVAGLGEADRPGDALGRGNQLLHQQRQHRPGRDHERAARVHQHRQRADRHEQQDREPALGATARVDHERQHHDVDQAGHVDVPGRGPPTVLEDGDQRQPGDEVAGAGAAEQGRVRLADQVRLAAGREHEPEHDRHQQPEHVQQPEHPPRQLGCFAQQGLALEHASTSTTDPRAGRSRRQCSIVHAPGAAASSRTAVFLRRGARIAQNSAPQRRPGGAANRAQRR